MTIDRVASSSLKRAAITNDRSCVGMAALRTVRSRMTPVSPIGPAISDAIYGDTSSLRNATGTISTIKVVRRTRNAIPSERIINPLTATDITPAPSSRNAGHGIPEVLHSRATASVQIGGSLSASRSVFRKSAFRRFRKQSQSSLRA